MDRDVVGHERRLDGAGDGRVVVVDAVQVRPLEVGRQDQQGVRAQVLGVAGERDRLGGGDGRGLHHEAGAAVDVARRELGDAPALLGPKIGELARAAAHQDDVDAGLQHGVDVVAERGFVDPLAARIEGRAQRRADALEFFHCPPPIFDCAPARARLKQISRPGSTAPTNPPARGKAGRGAEPVSTAG